MRQLQTPAGPYLEQVAPAAPAPASERLRAHVRLAALTVLLIPLHWLLGTALIWGYAAAFFFSLALFRFCAVEWVLSFFYAALVLGLAAAILGGAPGERVAGALYNLSIALVLLAFLNCGRRIQLHGEHGLSHEIYRAASVCFAVYIAYCALLLGALWTVPPGNIAIPSLLVGLAGELPGVLAEYSTADIALTDWTADGPVWRIVGFGMYATEGAILLTITGLLAALNAARQGRLGRAVLIEAAIGIVLVFMASRTTLGAYLLSLGLLAALFGRRALAPALLAAPLVLLGIVLAAVYGPGLVAELFETINKAREGSSGDRFRSYALAIDMVLHHNIWTGLGFKPRDPSLIAIPIGSHSTFIGAFTKGGIIGLAMLAVFYITMLVKLAQSQFALLRQSIAPDAAIELVYLSRCALVMLIWWVTEDFDAPVQTAAVAGLTIGLFLGLLARQPRQQPVWTGAWS